jgi:murein DD-endopeptidase MepM/ murein hydrolase activator NlpD
MLSRAISIFLICGFFMVYMGCGEPTQDTITLEQATSTIPTASSFVFPIQGKTIIDITKNIADPRNDGWKADNYFGHWCDDCGGWVGYHPGEDWNLVCPNGGAQCDFGEPVYAVADGLVTYSQKYPGEDIGDAIVIEHQLPGEENLSKYILPDTVFPTSENPVSRIIESGYLHLQSLQVTKGQMVRKGQMIAKIGFEKSPHLHFEIRWKTGNTVFAGYKPTHQTLTDRGLLVPTTFISAHTAPPPFLFTPTVGVNPLTCANQPAKDINGNLSCEKRTAFPEKATVWAAVQLEQVRKSTCFYAQYLKNGSYYLSSSVACLGAQDKLVYWARLEAPEVAKWQVNYFVGESGYSGKLIATSNFEVSPATAIPPPAPPPPLYQTAYVYAGVNLTGSQPFLSNTTTGGYDYIPSALQSTFTYGQSIFGIVKLHYLTANIRFRFRYELYRNGGLVSVTEEATWKATGNYGLVQAYALPTASPAVLGKFPDVGTWTLRTFIIIDGRFTNWVADQRVVVF